MIPPIFATLSANAGVTAIIGAGDNCRCYPFGFAKQGTVIPYVTWMKVSGQPLNRLSKGGFTDRIRAQVDCWAADSAGALALARAVRTALETTSCMVSLNLTERDVETRLYRYSMDFEFQVNRGAPAAPVFTPLSATGGTTADVDIGGRMYRVHTFTSSADFVVSALGDDNTVDYLIVGGGGGAGRFEGVTAVSGGGGGGGVKTGSFTASVATFPAVIGAGGAGVQTNGSSANGTDGNSSSFISLTSGGGGGGGMHSTAGGNATNGGSGGGGGGGSSNGTNPAGGTSSGGGFAGGAGHGSSVTNERNAGGGGGAGESGQAGSVSKAGDGGDGVQSSINGTATYYGGGGGGGNEGVGGLGGGASGANTGYPNASANTGGGGGGTIGQSATGGGNGGSGIIIIRYPLEAA